MDKLRELRKSKNLTMKELGQKLNLAESTISLYEKGQREPDFQTLKNLSDFFNVSIDYLLGRSDSNVSNANLSRQVVKVPVFGTIPAGVPIEMIADDFIDDYEEIDASLVRGGKVFFGLKIKGNSMFPEFKNGDIVIFEKTDDCETGSYCAVSINHTECTFKKILKKENGITLMPLNTEFDPMFFTNKEVIDLPITILGTAIEIRRSL